MRHLHVLLVALLGFLDLPWLVHSEDILMGNVFVEQSWAPALGDQITALRGLSSTRYFSSGQGGHDRHWTASTRDEAITGLDYIYAEYAPALTEAASETNLWAKYEGLWNRVETRNPADVDYLEYSSHDHIIVGVESQFEDMDRIFKIKRLSHQNKFILDRCRWLSFPSKKMFGDKTSKGKCSADEIMTGMRTWYDFTVADRLLQIECCRLQQCAAECGTCTDQYDQCTSCPISSMSVVDGKCMCTNPAEIMVSDDAGVVSCEPCRAGAKASINGDICVEINECTDQNSQFQHACDGDRTCKDTVGGYMCVCPHGWNYNENGRKEGTADESCSVEDTLFWRVSATSDGFQMELGDNPQFDKYRYNVSIWNEQGTIATLLDGYPKQTGQNGFNWAILDIAAGKSFKIDIQPCTIADNGACEWAENVHKSGTFQTLCGCEASSPSSEIWQPGYRQYSMSSSYGPSIPEHCFDNKAGTDCWTQIQTDPWVRIDLGVKHTIYQVALAEGWWPPNSDDEAMLNARRGKIEIWLSDYPLQYVNGALKTQGTTCRVFDAQENPYQPRYIPHSCEGNGRYITVLAPGYDRALKVAEVHVGLGLSPTSNMFCSTVDGTAPDGTLCSFPFTLDGTEYDRCTTIGNGNTPWCMVADGVNRGNCHCEYCTTKDGNVHDGSPCVFPFYIGNTKYSAPVTGVVSGGPTLSELGGSDTQWCSVTEEYAGAWGKAQCSTTPTTLLDPVMRTEMMEADPVCLIENTNKVCDFPFVVDGIMQDGCVTSPRPDGTTSSKPWCYSGDDFGTCDCSMTPGYVIVEGTGTPGQFNVIQEQGKFMYQWSDRSRCEEGFTFFRKTDAGRIAFADDYMFNAEDICGRRHSPDFVYEDILESNLALGSTHEYCMAAIGNMRSLNKYVSDEACFVVRVGFETIVNGRVATSLDKGNFGMEKTHISWSAGPHTGLQATDRDGKYTIHLISGEIAVETLDMTIGVSRTTGNITHQYLCDLVVPCVEKTISVRHLRYDQTVDFIDDTVNPMTGFVYIAGTEHRGLESGCPLAYAQVCLHAYPDTDEIYTCVNSTNTGSYLLPAVIGTTVAIELTYIKEDLHDFMRVGSAMAGNGTDIDDVEHWTIDADTKYEFIDYADVTTEMMRVEIAGGLCNRVIGDASLRIGIPHCPTWQKSITQSSMGENYEVPAHLVDVTFLEINRYGKPRAEISAYFDAVIGEHRTIGHDLSDLPAAQDKLQKPVEASLYRFEYHPKPSLSLEFSEAIDTKCKTAENERQYVVPAKVTTMASVYATEDFGDENIQTCDWVPGEVKIVSGLGANTEWKNIWKFGGGHTFSSDQIDIMDQCHSDNPCFIDLEPEEFGNVATAVDGDVSQAGIDPSFQPSNCWDNDEFTLCKVDPGETPWIELDLGRNMDISLVKLIPETKVEGQPLRTNLDDLGAYEIWISDTPATEEVDYQRVRQPKKCADGDISTQNSNAGPFFHNCIGNARYVRLQLPGPNRQLWLAEIQVFTPMFKNSAAEVPLVVAAPEPSPEAMDVVHPHTKQFYAKLHILPWDPTVLQAKVVITGDKAIMENERIGFPNDKPLTVIHDPPGGLSFTKYKGLRAHVATTISGKKKFHGGFLNFTKASGDPGRIYEPKDEKIEEPDRTVQAPIIGFPGLPHASVSLPYGARAKDNTFFNLYAHGKGIEGDYEFNWEDGDGVSVDITFQTSEAVGKPGEASDVFVVPGMSILFILTRVVTYDFDSCKASFYEEVKWSLAPEYQKPVLNFLSAEQIESKEMALLQKIATLDAQKKARLETDLSNCQNGDGGCPQAQLNNFTAEIANQQVKINNTNANYAKWQSMLLANRNLHEKAAAGELTWSFRGQLVTDQGLSFDELNNRWDEWTEEDGNKPLQGFSGLVELRFSGGGSKYEYYQQVEEPKNEEKLHAEEEGWQVAANIGWNSGSNAYDIGGGYKQDQHSGHTYKRSRDLGTYQGFTLGDPDMGDVFSVKVFTDPDYGTFVFHTVAGESMCPHEPRTNARVKPGLRLISGPAGKLAPDDTAVFKMMVENLGTEMHDFLLFTDAKTNPNGLEITVDGNPIWVPLEYDRMPAGGFPVVITAKRGQGYKFEDVKLVFTGTCEYKKYFPTFALQMEYWQKAEATISAEFLRLCPTVELAGMIKFDKFFTVNKTDSTQGERPNSVRVEGFNAKFQTEGLWSQNDRIQGVWVEYKSETEEHWRYALDATGTKLNLMDEENEYGFSFVDWPVATVPDGNYRLRLRTQCELSGSDVEGMDGYTSAEVRGIIDRKLPQQFGPVTPADGEYVPGKMVSVSFNENILCGKPYRFNLKLEVDGLDQVFEKRNMIIVCEGRKIGVHFRSSVKYDDVMGKFATVTFSQVEDMARNEIFSDAVADFQFGEIDLAKVSVVFESMLVQVPYVEGMEDLTSEAALLVTGPMMMEFAALVGLAPTDAYRIKINQIHQAGDEIIAVDWVFGPDNAGDVVAHSATSLVEVLRHELLNTDCEADANINKILCKIIPEPEIGLAGVIIGDHVVADGAGPCPGVEFHEVLRNQKNMIFNTNTGTQLNLVALNPGVERWDMFGRLMHVGCQYRQFGGDWMDCLDDQGVALNFAIGEYNHQNSALWDIGLEYQGKLEVHLVSHCRPFNNIASADDTAYSSSLFIDFDVEPPRALGELSPQVYTLGETLTFTFSEPIQCVGDFSATVLVEGNYSLHGYTLSHKCEGNTVAIGFPSMDPDLFGLLAGMKANVTLNGVIDNAKNLQDQAIVGYFKFGTPAHLEKTASVTLDEDRFHTESLASQADIVSVSPSGGETYFMLEMAALAIVNFLLIAAIFVRCLNKQK